MRWPLRHIFSPRPRAANPAITPSTTRPASPIHRLSTAYLKKNATASTSVTTPMRLIQVRPTRVSSASVLSGSAAAATAGASSTGSGSTAAIGSGGGVATGSGGGAAGATGAARGGASASIPWAASRRASRASIPCKRRCTDRMASVRASMRSPAGGIIDMRASPIAGLPVRISILQAGESFLRLM